jgi:carbon storage regulator
VLMLTRRVGEAIDIGNDIVVKVVAVYGNQIRLGIEAPKEVVVVRSELNAEKIPAETSKDGNTWGPGSRHFRKP